MNEESVEPSHLRLNKRRGSRDLIRPPEAKSQSCTRLRDHRESSSRRELPRDDTQAAQLRSTLAYRADETNISLVGVDRAGIDGF